MTKKKKADDKAPIPGKRKRRIKRTLKIRRLHPNKTDDTQKRG